jgi:metal-responsive CopG/Arc/MetJ family transcriptional regulator
MGGKANSNNAETVIFESKITVNLRTNGYAVLHERYRRKRGIASRSTAILQAQRNKRQKRDELQKIKAFFRLVTTNDKEKQAFFASRFKRRQECFWNEEYNGENCLQGKRIFGRRR